MAELDAWRLWRQHQELARRIDALTGIVHEWAPHDMTAADVCSLSPAELAAALRSVGIERERLNALERAIRKRLGSMGSLPSGGSRAV